jgi:hypothetical protein
MAELSLHGGRSVQLGVDAKPYDEVVGYFPLVWLMAWLVHARGCHWATRRHIQQLRFFRRLDLDERMVLVVQLCIMTVLTEVEMETCNVYAAIPGPLNWVHL